METRELWDRATGDATYLSRLSRWEYILRRRASTPKATYEQIGLELGISKQNVARYIKRNTVRPSGRPRTDESRKRRLLARILSWTHRRQRKQLLGRDVSIEEKWIADLEGRLAALK